MNKRKRKKAHKKYVQKLFQTEAGKHLIETMIRVAILYESDKYTKTED